MKILTIKRKTAACELQAAAVVSCSGKCRRGDLRHEFRAAGAGEVDLQVFDGGNGGGDASTTIGAGILHFFCCAVWS